MAAKFNARFTIEPEAKPFTVAAVGDGGGVVFAVDPAAKRMTARAQTPTAAERGGDFSQTAPGTGFTTIDFVRNGNAMPGNIVPAVRIDPAAVAALRSIPPPNAGAGETPNFVYEDAAPAAGVLAIDDTTKANSFGVFLPVPYAPWLESRNTAFKLYVDGKLVATDNVKYALPYTPPAPVLTLASLVLSPSVVYGGTPVQGTVSFNIPAPAGGVTVNIVADNLAAVSLVRSVTVAEGKTSASFTVDVRPATERTTVAIIASIGADTRRATLTVNASSSSLTGPFGMQFVSIAPGEFMRGCSPGDTECFPMESPQKLIKITKSFEIGKFEVTQGQWQAVMGGNPSWVRDPRDPDNPNRPVQMVSWNDTQNFLAALNRRNDGYRYRLPTEAEWEYAARAGSADKLAGAGTKAEVACIDLYNTCVAGSFKPNAWGLYDTIGNVNEFCSDWFNENYYSIAPSVDPQGPETGTQRPTRGGSWGIGGERRLRVSSRVGYAPGQKNLIFGFRCVRQRIGN